jgi:polysaccharide biosynthesis transport protein
MKPEQEGPVFSAVNHYENAEYLGLESLESNEPIQKRGINVGPTVRLLRRNLFLILFPTLAFGAAALYLSSKTPETYIGNFQMLVEPITSEARSAQASSLAPGQNPSPGAIETETLDYGTLTRVLKSPSLLELISQQLRNRGIELTVDELGQGLMVFRIGNEDPQRRETKLIETTFEHEEPQAILATLEVASKIYTDYGKEERRKNLGEGLNFIEKELAKVRPRVSTLESQIQALQQRYRISDLDSEGAALATQAREIETQRQQVQQELQAQKQLYANLERQLGLNPNQAIAASQLSENPNIQAYRAQLQQLEAQIATKSSTLAPGHPELIALQEQRENIAKLLGQATQQVVGSSLPTVAQNPTGSASQPQSGLQKNLGEQLVNTLNQVQVLEIRNQAMNQAAATIEQQLRQFPVVKRQYNELQGQLDIARSSLNQFLLKQEDLMVQAAQQDIPWQIISQPALVKDKQGNNVVTSDGGLKKVALATLGGFLLGLGVALLKEKRQNIFYGVQDLQDAVNLKLLGVIPLNKELKAVSKSFQEVPSEGDEEDMQARLYAMDLLKTAEGVYTNLRFLPSDRPTRSLVITALGLGDGATTLAINLAKAAAGMGQRVLLVDANMSQPQLHLRFGLPNFQGLSDVLRNQVDPNQVIARSPFHANLYLLPAGPTNAKVTKMLAANQMQFVMEQLHHMYDLVVYDSTHLQGNSGANFLAVNADGMVLVVGIKKTSRSLFLKAIDRIRGANITILGMVANFAEDQPHQRNETDGMEIEEDLFASDVTEADEFEIFRVGS